MFRPGGPYNIRRTGTDQYSFSVPLPVDDAGMAGRECPEPACSPGYFKVKLGTGVVGDAYTRAYCPYCRREGEPGDFHTKAQADYARSIATREAVAGVRRGLSEALGLNSSGKKKIGGGFISMEMSLKPSPLPSIRHPLEETLRRDVTCPGCTLQHAVFGLATWCPDCGGDVFLIHLHEELNVIRAMLGDISGRRQRLGDRVAAADLANALEDVVSTFEAAMKHVTWRRLAATLGPADLECELRAVGTAYQTVARTREIANRLLGLDPFGTMQAEQVERLNAVLIKRHPITHNLGIVDRKYLEQARAAESLGREVRLTEQDVHEALVTCEDVLVLTYRRLFPDALVPAPTGAGTGTA